MTSDAAARLLALAHAKFTRACEAIHDAPSPRARDRHARRAAQWSARIRDLETAREHAEKRATFARETVSRLPGLAFLNLD